MGPTCNNAAIVRALDAQWKNGAKTSCSRIEVDSGPPAGDVAVGSILKALGLTIWGLIGFGLLAIFLFVGYEAALKHRASSSSTVNESATNDQLKQSQLGPSGGIGPIASADRTHDVAISPAAPRTSDSTRKLLLSAIQNRQYESAIEYGQQLVDGKSAGPADLSIVAQSYLSISDCSNAKIWARKAKDAFQKAGMEPDEALRRIAACCVPGRNIPRIVLDPAEKARIDRFLSKTDAAKSESGGPFVRLGELYYGFGEYELAIASIQLGLNKGQIAHLDEAYVYLGRAEQAVGDFEEARNAFNKLKDVPGISARVLRLWTLYAETQLSASTDGNPRTGRSFCSPEENGPEVRAR
jgi:tetratricopeptide (TPR) repeat protein